MGLQRPAKVTRGLTSGRAAEDAEMAGERPTLHDYLTMTTYEDRTSRVPATLTVFAEEGVFKAALHDKDNRRSLYLSGETLSDLLDGLETALHNDVGDWRRWKGEEAEPQPKRRRGGLTARS